MGRYREHEADTRIELVAMWGAPTHRRRGVGHALHAVIERVSLLAQTPASRWLVAISVLVAPSAAAQAAARSCTLANYRQRINDSRH